MDILNVIDEIEKEKHQKEFITFCNTITRNLKVIKDRSFEVFVSGIQTNLYTFNELIRGLRKMKSNCYG